MKDNLKKINAAIAASSGNNVRDALHIALIKVEKLESRVAELENDFRDCMDQYNFQQKRACDAEARVAELERLLEANHWILTSERLPEMNPINDSVGKASETVLVDWFGSCKDENSEHFGETWRTVEKAWVLDDIWMNSEGYEVKINSPEAPTCWMPLPSLPEEDAGGEE